MASLPHLIVAQVGRLLVVLVATAALSPSVTILLLLLVAGVVAGPALR